MQYFSWTQWQYGNLVLFFAFLFSIFTIYVMRNLDQLGIKKDFSWLTGRIIIFIVMALGAWLGGCIEAAWQREEEMLSLVFQIIGNLV